ncbi:MAG: hypothetical protein RMJ30_07570, partial [Nitrososphaerota archaeon]|nr:hypothetical protein [Nitrososphaerota archaeon]
ELPPSHPIQFIYLEKYGEPRVRNYKSIERGKLAPGKWYYLRAPRFFEEVLLPKLTHKLKEFAEIRFGIKTGANEFFYMKDVTHLYEADYLANPKKFHEWGVKARTAEELRQQGLIYIKNEGGERFVIDKNDVRPILRSPKQIRSYLIKAVNTLCLYTTNPGKFARRYIEWGVSKGYHKRPTCKGRQPWYKLPDFEPAHVLLPMSWMNVAYIAYSRKPILYDARLYGLYHRYSLQIWKYLNSTLFLLTVELLCRRLGGGATDIKVEDYQNMPVPNLSELNINFNEEFFFSRRPLPYHQEVKQPDRRELDKAVLRALGFDEKELDRLVDELHKAFVEVVEDRLIKAGRPLREEELKTVEVETDDEDNR